MGLFILGLLGGVVVVSWFVLLVNSLVQDPNNLFDLSRARKKEVK